MDVFPLVLDGVRVIGWALLHFLWQAILIGMTYASIRSLLPRGEWRYRFGIGVLIVLAACPLLTVWWLSDSSSASGQPVIDTMTLAPLSAVTEGMRSNWIIGLDVMLPWVVLAWSMGVLLLSLRAWRQWRRLKVLVSVAERVSLWQARLDKLARRFGLRTRIEVLRSELVVTPVLIGWIRPVILLPLAVTCEFPVDQVELILAHELAHLKRWDPLVNLFQLVLETLYFYHPIVHWISRDVRNEREICCDRLALSVTDGSRREFAATLAQLGELRGHAGSLILAASGGVLLDRVQYMVQPGAQSAHRSTPARLVAVLLGTVLIALTLRLERGQTGPQEAIAGVSSVVSSVIAPLAITMKSPLIPTLNVQAAAFLPYLAPLHASPVIPDRVYATARVTKASLLPAPITTVPVEMLPIQPVMLPKTIAGMLKVAPMAGAWSKPTAVSAAALVPIRVRQPVYPQLALMRGVEGRVVIEFGLAADGSLQDVQVVHSDPAGVFDQAAVHAMQGWKYPAPTAVGMQRRYLQTMKFVLNAALARNHTSSGARSGEEIHARADCQIPTGTHICRWPGDGEGFVKSQL